MQNRLLAEVLDIADEDFSTTQCITTSASATAVLRTVARLLARSALLLCLFRELERRFVCSRIRQDGEQLLGAWMSKPTVKSPNLVRRQREICTELRAEVSVQSVFIFIVARCQCAQIECNQSSRQTADG